MLTDPTTLTLGQGELEAKPEPEDLQLWSVTTILGCLEKQGLLYWAAEQTAIAAIRSANTWKAMMATEGEAEAVKWLRDARFRRPKSELSAAALGTVVHKACEEYALTGIRPTMALMKQFVEGQQRLNDGDATRAAIQAAVFVDRFDEWLQKFQPSYQATEVVVYHPDYGYAGTSDAFLTVGGVRAIVDYKTSMKSVDSRGKATAPYPEAALQISAYRYAKFAAAWRPRVHEVSRRRYYLLSQAEQNLAAPVPEVDAGLVIHITPEHCNAHLVRCDESVFESFLFCLEAARWQFELSKAVVGFPLTPAGELLDVPLSGTPSTHFESVPVELTSGPQPSVLAQTLAPPPSPRRRANSAPPLPATGLVPRRAAEVPAEATPVPTAPVNVEFDEGRAKVRKAKNAVYEAADHDTDRALAAWNAAGLDGAIDVTEDDAAFAVELALATGNNQ